MSFPIATPLRAKMKALVQAAFDAVNTRQQLLRSSTEPVDVDPDDELVSFTVFQRMLDSKVFAKYFTSFIPFGKRGTNYCDDQCMNCSSHSSCLCVYCIDSSAWVYDYEEQFYCPALLKTLKIRRREARNNIVVMQFRREIQSRWKRIGFFLWTSYIERRFSTRVFFLWYEARMRYDVTGRCFDRWRKLAIADHCAREIQRLVRGFIGRCRRNIIREVIKKSVVLQSVSRRARQRNKYIQLVDRRHWASITVQVWGMYVVIGRSS
jgi:hypothetical protein